MTDQLTKRLEQLEHRVALHERDLSRAVRIIDLARTGHTVPEELAELTRLANRYPRFPAPDPPAAAADPPDT